MLVFVVNPFETFFPNLGGLTVGRIVGLLTMLVWLIYLARNKKAWARATSSRLLYNQIPFHLAAFLGALVWFSKPEGINALSGAITFLILGILALMVESIIDDVKKLRIVATGMAIAGVLACIPAFMYIFGFDLYTLLGAEPPSDLNEETERASSIGGSPNALGIIARNGIFASILVITISKKRWVSLLMWGFIFVCFSSIILAGSRTNFYGSIIVFLVIGYFAASDFFKNPTRIITALVLVLAIGIYGFQFAPESIKQRLLFGADDDRIAERANSRVDFTKYQQDQAWEFVGKYPLVGVGIDRTYIESGWVAGAHDTLSVILGEMGFLGILSFLWLMAWAAWSIWKMLRIRRNNLNKVQLALLLGTLLSMLVMGYAGGFIIPYDRAFWMTLGLMMPLAKWLNFQNSKTTSKAKVKNQIPSDFIPINQLTTNESHR